MHANFLIFSCFFLEFQLFWNCLDGRFSSSAAAGCFVVIGANVSFAAADSWWIFGHIMARIGPGHRSHSDRTAETAEI